MSRKRFYLNFDAPNHRTLVGYDLTPRDVLAAIGDYARLLFRGRRPRFVREPHWPPR